MTSVAQILIVDDDPINAKLLGKAVAGLGTIHVATSGAAAIQRAAAYPIDLVLLDIVMPDMDGFAACRALQRDAPDIPIIFVTAAGDVGSEIRAFEVGGRDFITKPINPIAVRARVASQLNLKAKDAQSKSLEEKLRGITDAAHDAIVMMDPEGAISFWNPAATAMLGYSAAESLGRNLHELLAPECYLSAHRGAFSEFKRTGRGAAMGKMIELTARRKDGQEIPIEISLASLTLKDGWHSVGILRDLTERKRAAAELSKKEEELRSVRAQLERTAYELTENIPAGTYTMVLPRGETMAKFSFMSERFLELTGLDREVTSSDPIKAFACVHPDDYADWMKLNAEVFAQKRPFLGETRILLDGEVRWIAVESTPRPLPDGSTVWEGVLMDITERKRMEEHLKQSEARFRELFEWSPMAYQSLDEEGHFLDVNHELCELLGYGRDELIGRSFGDYWSRDRAHQFPSAFSCFKQNGTTRGELDLVRSDGAPRTVLLEGRIQRGLDGRFVRTHCILYDITERKRRELELEQTRGALLAAKEQAEIANRSLQAANQELHQLATRDALTGAWNRRHFEQAAAAEIARAQRYGPPRSLAIFDIDHFKSINDHYGHPTGDRVLVELSQLVQHNLRASDMLARWGGEEFVVLMPQCQAAAAMGLAEKLRILIATHPFPGVPTITASFGVAELRAKETLDDWLKRADDALYAAKAAGRNQVSMH